MKSLKEIMSELGFSPGAPEGTQRAFIKHLIQAANQKEQEQSQSLEFQKIKLQSNKAINDKKTTRAAGRRRHSVVAEQLSFDFENKKQVS